MTEIKLHTYGERLIVTEKVTLSSGNVNSAIVVVEFDEIWKGYPNKCAIFSREGKDGVEVLATQILDTDGNIVDEYFKIPASVLKTKGVLEIGIRGDSKDGGKVLTSTIIRYNIERGANLGTITLEPDMDLYRQYLAAMDEGTASLFNAYKENMNTKVAELESDYAAKKKELDDYKADLTALLSGDVLWTNPTPTEEFAATTISKSLTAYKRITIISKNNTSNEDDGEIIVESLTLYHKNATHYGRYRRFSFNNSGITISKTVNGSTSNAIGIPLEIIGYKY